MPGKLPSRLLKCAVRKKGRGHHIKTSPRPSCAQDTALLNHFHRNQQKLQFQGNGGGLAVREFNLRRRYIFCAVSYFAVEEEGKPISLRLTGVRSIDEHPEPQEADDWGALSVQFVGHCKGPCGLEWFVLASLNGTGEKGKLVQCNVEL